MDEPEPEAPPAPVPVVAEPEEEETLAMLKPDVVGKAFVVEEMVTRAELEGAEAGADDDDADEGLQELVPRRVVKAEDSADDILARIKASGLRIVESRRVLLTREQAQEFYAEHRGKPFFHALVQFMTSGPCLALRLRGVDAISTWRAIQGPTNPEKARAEYAAQVAELQAQLSQQLEKIEAIRAAKRAKEEAAAAREAIRQERIAAGEEVEPEPAEEEEEEDDDDDEDDSDNEKPREETEEDILPLVDPTAVENTIRGVHGTTGTRNASHGSDSTFSAQRELEFFFGCEESRERTLAMIKPDAVEKGYVPQILARLEEEGFYVLADQELTLSVERAGQFYSEHRGKEFFEPLVKFMSSGPIHALVLERVGAVKRWRRLMGPTNPEQARDCAPRSMRALYAESTRHNAVHGSDSRASADRELAFFFPEPLAYQRTYAMIKPGASQQDVYAIKKAIEDDGFVIHREAVVQLTPERAGDFYAEHKGRPFYPNLVRYMSSGSVVAMVLAKPNGIRCWRQLAGPTNTFTARDTRPNSLRARFGVDGTKNAVHGSDSPASARREMEFFFPDLFPDQLPTVSVTQYFRSKQVAHPSDAAASEETLHTLLTRGLSELVREQPEGGDLGAIQWLGEWLLRNNPRTGAVVEAEDAAADGPELLARSRMPDAAAVPRGIQRVKLHSRVKPLMVFAVGGPLSGVTTHCAAVAESLGLVHIEVKALIEAEAASESRHGRKIRETLANGEPLPGKTVTGLIKREMRRFGDRHRFLLDTFPADLQTALAFEENVGKPDFVLHLEVPEEQLLSRLKHQAREHAKLNPGQARQSAAEEAEKLQRRVQAWSDGATPVIEFYGKSGYLRSVSGTGPIENITPLVRQAMAPQITLVVGPSGSGRTTVVRELASRLDMAALRLSELVEREINTSGPHAAAIRELVAAGRAVPDAVATDLVHRAILATPSNRVVLDGFPNSAAQALALEAAVGVAPRVVVSLEGCPREECLRRVAARGRSKGQFRDDRNASLRAARFAESEAAAAEVAALYKRSLLARSVCADAALAAVAQDSMAAAAPPTLMMLGGPGSGKTSQCARLARRFGHCVLSAANVLRAEVARKSDLGLRIDDHLREGQGVPVSLTFAALQAAMAASGASSFVLDDFPRTLEQAERFETEVGPIDAAVVLDLSLEATEARLQEADPSRLQGRYAQFLKSVSPAIDFLALQGKVRNVSGVGLPNAVFTQICTAVERTHVLVLGAPGVGKTALCRSVPASVHIQFEALVAAEAERGTALARELAEESTPELRARVVAEAIRRCGASRVTLDGFPRSTEEAAAFEQQAGSFALAVELQAPREVTHARFLQAQPQHRGRKAANEREAAAAEAAFDEETAPLLELMRGQGHLTTLDATQDAAHVAAAVGRLLTPSVLLLEGPPRSGKRSLAARLGREFRYELISTSQLLHAEADAGTADGRAIAEVLGKSTVPLEITLRLLARALARSSSSRVLISGFPRVVGASEFPSFADQMAAFQLQVAPIERMLHITAPEDVRRSRSRSQKDWERDDERYFFEKAGAVRLFDSLGKLHTVSADGSLDIAYSQLRMLILDCTQARRRSYASASGSPLGSAREP